MKFVSSISDKAILETLKCASRLAPQPYVRERTHTILLSNRGFTIEKIAEVFDIRYQTVSIWIDDWEKKGIAGLYKEYGGGTSPTYDPDEIERAKQLISEEPRRIGYAKAVLESETKKKPLFQR